MRKHNRSQSRNYGKGHLRHLLRIVEIASLLHRRHNAEQNGVKRRIEANRNNGNKELQIGKEMHLHLSPRRSGKTHVLARKRHEQRKAKQQGKRVNAAIEVNILGRADDGEYADKLEGLGGDVYDGRLGKVLHAKKEPRNVNDARKHVHRPKQRDEHASLGHDKRIGKIDEKDGDRDDKLRDKYRPKGLAALFRVAATAAMVRTP